MAAAPAASASREARALVRLGAEELASAPGGIRALHQAIADRAFSAAGPGARPARAVHDAVSEAVYAAVAQALRLGGRAAEAAAGSRARRLVSETPGGAALVGIVNGLIGDTLEEESSELSQPMGIRIAGAPVEPRPAALAAAFPQAGPRLVVFLHGLMETEFSWGEGECYGSRLASEAGWTPLYLRYNSGLRISENGRRLSRLLEETVAAWPVEVRRIALVGHSMGGLVARSGAHTAQAQRARWLERLTQIVSLGSPHRGAPLEEIVHLGSALLDLVPETRGLSRFLRRRSGGIRDLRRGSLVDEDWRGRDPDALRAAACAEVPLLDGVTHCFVSASLTRGPSNPLGRLVGDMLVLRASAAPWRGEEAFHLDGAGHFALLNHPRVYERLRAWLA